MALNKVMVIGNLGKDPEIKYLQDGQAVANFSVAVNENWTDKAGKKQEKVEWIRVVVWGKTAENCAKYLSKGKQVFIEGKMQTREWMDKEDKKNYITEVQALNVQFLGHKESGERPPHTADLPGAAQLGQQSTPFNNTDDIPF